MTSPYLQLPVRTEVEARADLARARRRPVDDDEDVLRAIDERVADLASYSRDVAEFMNGIDNKKALIELADRLSDAAGDTTGGRLKKISDEADDRAGMKAHRPMWR